MECSSYVDLNLIPLEKNIEELLKTLYKYHVKTVAINQTLDCTSLEEKKKKVKQDDVVPEPMKIDLPNNLRGKMSVFNRITIKFVDVSQLYKVGKSSNFKKFHIVAAIPLSQQALQHCCSTSDIDIICFESETRPQWKMSRKLYNMALDRRIFFELSYSPSIIDSSCRKNNIQMAQCYNNLGRSKNVIVSSSANNAFYVRSPYDVISLVRCSIFGLDHKAAKDALLISPQSLLKRAGIRRQGKSMMSVSCKRKFDDAN